MQVILSVWPVRSGGVDATGILWRYLVCRPGESKVDSNQVNALTLQKNDFNYVCGAEKGIVRVGDLENASSCWRFRLKIYKLSIESNNIVW